MRWPIPTACNGSSTSPHGAPRQLPQHERARRRAPAQGLSLTLAVGTQSGREIDKFSKVGAGGTAASLVGAPLIDDCLAWLESRVIVEPHIQETYDLFLGQVVAAWADPTAFSKNRWHFPDQQRRSIHYLSGGSFVASGEAFDV